MNKVTIEFTDKELRTLALLYGCANDDGDFDDHLKSCDDVQGVAALRRVEKKLQNALIKLNISKGPIERGQHGKD